MGPYTKRQNSTALDDGWTVTDGDGVVIAHLDTELMADILLDSLNHPLPFALGELDYTYVDPTDRYIVSFIVGYDDAPTGEEGVHSPEEAAHYALQLTKDEESHHTHWYVHDRVTKETRLIQQGDIEEHP